MLNIEYSNRPTAAVAYLIQLGKILSKGKNSNNKIKKYMPCIKMKSSTVKSICTNAYDITKTCRNIAKIMFPNIPTHPKTNLLKYGSHKYSECYSS